MIVSDNTCSLAPATPTHVPAGYSIAGDAVHFDNGGESVRISGIVRVEALARNQQNEAWGRVLWWRDLDGREHRRAIPAQRFHETGQGLAQELAAEGLEIVPGRERKVMAYLGSFRPDARSLCVEALGWMDTTNDRLAFVLPDRVLGSAAKEEIVFQPERYSPTAKTIAAAGDLKDWHEAVASKVIGNPLLMFGVCASLASTLVKPANLDSGGFHLYGASSRGKTTWLQCAASVWGCGADPGQAGQLAMIRRWTVTTNGAEGLAAAHNDLVLPLDEIGSFTSRDFGPLVYLLAGGQGKTTLDPTRNLKGVRSWRTMLLSTGEKSSRQKIEEEGDNSNRGRRAQANAGQLLRLLDIPSGDQIIKVTYGQRPADFADSLKDACGRYYGVAGPAFVLKLIEEQREATRLRNEVGLVLALLQKELTPKSACPEVARACRRFALVATAGVLACRLGILPWPEDRAVEAVQAVQDLWHAEADTLTDADRGVLIVGGFCMQNSARFRNADDAQALVPNLVGYRRPGLFLFTSNGFREACGGLNHQAVARELKRRDLLSCNEDGRMTSKVPIAGFDSRPRCYVVKDKIVDPDADAQVGPGQMGQPGHDDVWK